MLCDGIALTWTPLYGTGRDLAPVGAWLLWVVALTIVAAFGMARPGAIETPA